MSTSNTFVVGDGEAGRVDHFLGTRFREASRKQLAALFAEGAVRVNGKRTKKGHLVKDGDRVSLARVPDSGSALHPVPSTDPLEIVYQDDALVVLCKAAGVASHPLAARETGTVANALVAAFPECAGIGEDPREAGLVHRLDMDTSGLLIAARTQEAWTELRASFRNHQVQKTYVAVVHGRPIGVECEQPLLQQGKRVVVDYAGLDAHTCWVEEARDETYCLVRCNARTGRMHQVRAHLAECGSPIVGDTLYGGSAQEAFSGHFLHAATIELTHPTSAEAMTFEAALPNDRADWLKALNLPTIERAPK